MASYLFKELSLSVCRSSLQCSEVTWKTDIRAMPHIVRTQSLQVGSIAVSKWKRLTTCPFHVAKLDSLLRNFIWELKWNL